MNYSIVAFDSLVEESQFITDSRTLFVTISPNPRTMVECIVKNKTHGTRQSKRPYGLLQQDIQYQYCLKVLKEDYLGLFSDAAQLFGVTELNECGNVHLHMLINAPNITNDVHLAIFRRDILNSYRTQQNLTKGRLNARDYMNNIVFVDPNKFDPDYFMKQQNQMLPRFKNYFL